MLQGDGGIKWKSCGGDLFLNCGHFQKKKKKSKMKINELTKEEGLNDENFTFCYNYCIDTIIIEI